MNGGDERVLCGQSRGMLAGRTRTRWPVVDPRQTRDLTGAASAAVAAPAVTHLIAADPLFAGRPFPGDVLRLASSSRRAAGR